LKKSLLQIPFGGWALATLKPIAIDRGNQKEALKMLLEQGIARLNEGLSVLIFPEGTRVAPGVYKKFNAGGAMLAQKSGFPVLPLAHNAGEFWPRNSFLKYPGVIKVKIGPLIDSRNKSTKEINAETETWILQAMSEISGQM
jgi:1-acyl-sn-glycerol-3-phosphate acyltransferase